MHVNSHAMYYVISSGISLPETDTGSFREALPRELGCVIVGQSKSSVCTKGQRHKDIPYHACQQSCLNSEIYSEYYVISSGISLPETDTGSFREALPRELGCVIVAIDFIPYHACQQSCLNSEIYSDNYAAQFPGKGFPEGARLTLYMLCTM
jgi:hypothetical protein